MAGLLYSVPEASLSDALDNARDKREARRKKNRDQYELYKKNKLEAGESVTPEDLYRERFAATGGGSFDMEDLGTAATDKAIAARHNTKVSDLKLSELTKRIEQKSKQKAQAFSFVTTEQKTFDEYKADLEKQVGKEAAGLLIKRGDLDEQSWRADQFNKKQAWATTEVESALWKRVGNQADIEKFYGAEPKWKKDLLTDIFLAEELKITQEANNKVVEAVINSNIQDIDRYSEDDLIEYVKNVATTILPRGQELSDEQAKKIAGLLSDRKRVAEEKVLEVNQSAFINKVKTDASLTAFINQTTDNADFLGNKDIHAILNQIALDSKLGQNYFGAEYDAKNATFMEDYEKKLGNLLGNGWLQRMRRMNLLSIQHTQSVREKEAVDLAVTGSKAAQTNMFNTMMAFANEKAENGTADEKATYKHFGKAGVGTQILTQITQAYYLPQSQLNNVMASISQSINDGADPTNIKQSIIAEYQSRGLMRWADKTQQIRNNNTSSFKMVANTPLSKSADAVISKLDTIIDTFKTDIENQPQNTYDFRTNQWTGKPVGWLDSYTDKLTSQYELMKKRIENTFMNTAADGMWDPDLNQVWRGNTGPKSIGKALLVELKEEYEQGLQDIKNITPTGMIQSNANKVLLPAFGVPQDEMGTLQAQVINPVRQFFIPAQINQGIQTGQYSKNELSGILRDLDMYDMVTQKMKIPEKLMYKTSGLTMYNGRQTQVYKGDITNELLTSPSFKKFAMDIANKVNNDVMKRGKAQKYIRNVLLLGVQYDDRGAIVAENHVIADFIDDYKAFAGQAYDPDKPYSASLNQFFPNEAEFTNNILMHGQQFLNEQ